MNWWDVYDDTKRRISGRVGKWSPQRDDDTEMPYYSFATKEARSHGVMRFLTCCLSSFLLYLCSSRSLPREGSRQHCLCTDASALIESTRPTLPECERHA